MKKISNILITEDNYNKILETKLSFSKVINIALEALQEKDIQNFIKKTKG